MDRNLFYFTIEIHIFVFHVKISKKMNPLTYFAKQNAGKARVIITISNTLTGILLVMAGKWMYFEHFRLSDEVLYIGVIMGFFGFFFYPFKTYDSDKSKKEYTQTRKPMDIFLLGGAGLTFLYMGNHFYQYISAPLVFSELYAGSPSPSIIGFLHQPISEATPFPFKALGEMHWAFKVLLMILLLALCVGFGYVTIVMGCGIACAGYETLASYFLLGSGMWIIPLGILGGHHLFGKKPPGENGKMLRKVLSIVGVAGLILSSLIVLALVHQVSIIIFFVLLLFSGLGVYYLVRQFMERKEPLNPIK